MTNAEDAELQAALQKAVSVMMQLMVRLLPLALQKKIPDAEWKSFSTTVEAVQARAAALQEFERTFRLGEPLDVKAAVTSIFALKASMDDFHGSVDELLVLTGSREDERVSVREILVESLQRTLDRQEEQFRQVLAGLSDKSDSS